MSEQQTTTPGFKPKKSVALSGTAAGNTALCTVGRTGNDLAYRGYDILDLATTTEFEEIAYLLVHGKLPTVAELAGYKLKLKALRGIPAAREASPGSPAPFSSPHGCDAHWCFRIGLPATRERRPQPPRCSGHCRQTDGQPGQHAALLVSLQPQRQAH